jgi:hypothetical protein
MENRRRNPPPDAFGAAGRSNGGGLKQVTNGESGKPGDMDPSWSPDGASLAFGVALPAPTSGASIHVVDLKTSRISSLPGSQGMWSPLRKDAASDPQTWSSLAEVNRDRWFSIRRFTFGMIEVPRFQTLRIGAWFAYCLYGIVGGFS